MKLRLREYKPEDGRLREQASGRTVCYMAIDAQGIINNPMLLRSTEAARRIIRCVNEHEHYVVTMRNLLDALDACYALLTPTASREVIDTLGAQRAVARAILQNEDSPMKPEINKAAMMLFKAGVKNPKPEDRALLGADILEVAGEIAGETGDPAFYVADAAREIEQRIGGLEKLPAYMKTLRNPLP